MELVKPTTSTNPLTATQTAPILPVVRRTRADLERELQRGVAAGEYQRMSAVVRIPAGTYAGQYAARVRVLRAPAPPPPAWHRAAKLLAAVAGTIALSCSVLAWAVGYAVSAMTAAAQGVPWGLVGGVAGAGLAAGFVAWRGLGRGCSFTVTHRH